MKTGLSILSLLLLSSLTLADEYTQNLKSLQKSQNDLNQLMAPYRTLSHLKDQASDNAPTENGKLKPLIQIHNSITRLQASPGKLLFGKTATRLVVGGEASPALIDLNTDQGVFSELRIIAIATQGATAGRLHLQTQKIIYRSGNTQSLQGVILDDQGALGIAAQVISQKALSVAGALGTSFISGLAASEQSTSANAFGFETTKRSTRNSVLGGLAQTAADQSKRFIDEATNEKPVLILDSGTNVTIFVQDEVKF